MYLAPVVPRSDFIPDMLFLGINGRIADKHDVDNPKNLGLILLDTLPPGAGRKDYRIVLEDKNQAMVEALHCIQQNFDPGIQPTLKIEWHGEQLRLSVPQKASLKALYFFTENSYLGKMADSAEAVDLDTRPMLAGKHRLWMVPVTSEGVLLPPVTADLAVSSRYTITSDETGTVHVAVDNYKGGTKVHCAHQDTVGIVKTQVSIAGEFIGESDQTAFDMTLPLHNVPTGTAAIEVVGIAKDGTVYPTESLTINVKNEEWEARVGSTPEYREIVSIKPELARLEQEAQYWYTRASNEPAFTEQNALLTKDFTDEYGRELTTTFLQTLRIPGHAGEYLANSKRAIVQMAQMRLRMGRLYKSLKMRAAAKTTFRQVIREAGEDSPTGIAARQELAQMDLEKDQH